MRSKSFRGSKENEETTNKETKQGKDKCMLVQTILHTSIKKESFPQEFKYMYVTRTMNHDPSKYN